MKRISHIVNPQGIRSESLTRREDRIRRQVDQAIDMTKDKAAEADEKADQVIDTLGKTSGIDQTSDLQKTLQSYLQFREEGWQWKRQTEFLEELKVALDKDVDITHNPTLVKVIKDSAE